MSDRDPTVPDGGTSELEPAVPGGARTDPIDPGEPVTPPPPGGYASLRRTGPGIPGGLIVIAVLILAVGFVFGFLIGSAGTDEAPPAGERVERGDGPAGGQGGGDRAARRERRRACRQAIDLGARMIELQRRALTNQVAVTEALVAEDAERIGALTTAGEALQVQIEQAEARLAEATEGCRLG